MRWRCIPRAPVKWWRLSLIGYALLFLLFQFVIHSRYDKWILLTIGAVYAAAIGYLVKRRGLSPWPILAVAIFYMALGDALLYLPAGLALVAGWHWPPWTLNLARAALAEGGPLLILGLAGALLDERRQAEMEV